MSALSDACSCGHARCLHGDGARCRYWDDMAGIRVRCGCTKYRDRDPRATLASSRHPVQPLYHDENGTLRFKHNAIVQFLLDAGPFDLNMLARMPWSVEDREQLAMLIGYSLGGFAELSYVTDETYERASTQGVRQ